MNILFTSLFLICAFCILCHSPENFLAAMLEGGGKAASTCAALVATYAVWMGLMRVWEDSGVAQGFAKLLRPVSKKILKTEDEEALKAASMNLSVNLLGISGVGTAYGVTAARLLDKTENADYSSAMLFVLNATSLQIFPASIIAVRVAMQSAAPNDILLPTLFTTLFSTVLGVALTRIFLYPKSKERQNAPNFVYRQKTLSVAEKTTPINLKKSKTRGICTR